MSSLATVTQRGCQVCSELNKDFHTVPGDLDLQERLKEPEKGHHVLFRKQQEQLV